jgi:AcrR family transcriptional regulator
MSDATASLRPGRQQRSLVTQDKVLDAAVQALIHHGYAGASTLRIQEMAGVSRGRLLHQFPSRDALLVAAVQHLAQARVEAMMERLGPWPDDPAERVEAAVDAMWSTYQQDYFWAATELWLAARHDEELRDALLPEERRLYRRIRSATDEMFGSDLTGREVYPWAREVLNTSMRGVALTYSFDRRRAERDPHLIAWKAFARQWLLPEDRDGVA